MHGYLTRNVLGTFEKQAPDHVANPLKRNCGSVSCRGMPCRIDGQVKQDLALRHK